MMKEEKGTMTSLSGNEKEIITKKRTLASLAKQAPPPLAASSQRLAAILDGKTKKKRRKVHPSESTLRPRTSSSSSSNITNLGLISSKQEVTLEHRTLQHARGWKPPKLGVETTKVKAVETKSTTTTSKTLKSKSATTNTMAQDISIETPQIILDNNRLSPDNHENVINQTKQQTSVDRTFSSKALGSLPLSSSSTLFSVKNHRRVQQLANNRRERLKVVMASTPTTLSCLPRGTDACTKAPPTHIKPVDEISSIQAPNSLTLDKSIPTVQETSVEPIRGDLPVNSNSGTSTASQVTLKPTNSDNIEAKVTVKTTVSSVVKSNQQSKLESRDSSKTSDSTYRPNLVRLNLQNSNGACRHSRVKKAKTRPQSQHQGTVTTTTTTTIERPAGICSQTGMDPVDDFVDGIDPSSSKAALLTKQGIPLCQGHQQPCRLRTVRKTGSNKGRKFYACALERREQCNFFCWADESAVSKLPKDDSTSAFVQRQVAAYLENLKTLTLPELRVWAAARSLDTRGKRGQVWTRIALYVRDEIASGLDQKHNQDDPSTDSGEEDELELTGAPGSKLDLNPLLSKRDVTRDDAENKSEGLEDDLNSDSAEEEESEDELEIEGIPPTGKIATIHSFTDCPLRRQLRSLFGHQDFRPGQEWTIRRCLEGERTLLVAPTGLGKSLCYALPAAMQPEGVVLVVSPLLSLIQDQLRELPPSLPAASLSGNTPSPTLLQDLRRGRLRILFVSPERLVSPSFRRLLSKTSWNESTHSYERIMPPVSLFCVDEAHCLSQWGHNFRPCYLRLQSILHLIRPKSVLAITATAGPRVINDITRTLGMPKLESSVGDDTKGIKIFKADRDNIDVTAHFVADHADRLNRLVAILSPCREKQDSQDGCLSRGSVIVYVWRQMDAEAVADFITGANVPGKVVVYHGGMESGARAKSQSLFLRGKARICVATVAFGLGINKADVAGVIHMYLPASPEHYLQEIGRAGRDGSDARAIALIIPEEVQVRHSMSHPDLLARSQVLTLFQMLRSEVNDALSKLSDDAVVNIEGLCVGLSLESALVGCECKPETVETIFSLLEARDDPLLRVQGTFYGRAILAPRKQTLEELASKEHVIGAVMKCCQCVEPPAGEKTDEQKVVRFSGHNLVGQTYGSFCFSIAQCANCLGPDAEPRHVFAALRRLKDSGQIEYVLDTTQGGRYIHMRLNRSILNILTPEGSHPPILNNLVDEAHNSFNMAVASSAEKVIRIRRILHIVSGVSDTDMYSRTKSASLHRFQELIQDYLDQDGTSTHDTKHELDHLGKIFSPTPTKKALDLSVWSVVQHLQQMQLARASTSSAITPMPVDHGSSADYTALAVTKFLHGIAPASASRILCRQHTSFGSMQSVEFNSLLAVIASIIG